MKKTISSLLIGALLAQAFFSLALFRPMEIDQAVITAATATLSNPRRSYMSTVNGAHVAGAGIIAINADVNPESTVQGLFPGDTVMVGPNGSETVSSIPTYNGTNFVISGGLNVGASDNDLVIATQSGTLSVTFTIGSAISANGYVELTIPDPSATQSDGRPNYDATLANAGFDSNGITVANTTTSGGNGCTWSGAETFTAGTGNGHVYSFVTTTQCNSGTITMVVGDGTKGLVNPGRIGAVGTADVYQLNIKTKTSAGVEIETRDVSVAIVEGVLVSANVDETLSFTVAGRTGAACGATSTLTTSASTVPWGVLSTTYASGTHNASQELTLSTNSTSGYEVYAQETDQMGLNGNVCTGATPSSGQYTFSAGTCIRDVGVGSISHIVAADWGATPGVNYGLGYSLEEQDAGIAEFEYNDSGSWLAKQFADQESTEDETADGAEIMSRATGPVSADNLYVCYRINIPTDQPSGYYYNVVKYTAVPIF